MPSKGSAGVLEDRRRRTPALLSSGRVGSVKRSALAGMVVLSTVSVFKRHSGIRTAGLEQQWSAKAGLPLASHL